MALPLALALGGHAALALMLIRLPVRDLTPAADAPGIAFVVSVMASATPQDGPAAPMPQEAAAATAPVTRAPPEDVEAPSPSPPVAAPPPVAKPRAVSPAVVKPVAATAAAPPAPPSAPRPVAAGASGAVGAAGPPAADPNAVAAWQAALSAWIDRHRTYPRAARHRQEEGVVQVRFELDGAGQVLRVDLHRPSGSALLDEAALALLREARLPAPPPRMDPARRKVTVAIRYRLE